MIKDIKITKTAVPDVTQITAEGWDGRILKMSRNAYRTWRERGQIPPTATAYILYADHFDKSLGKELYVGQANSIDVRVDQHVGQKDYWTMLLVFVSAEDWMNVAHAQHIEQRLIVLAKQANRYDVKNGTDGNDLYLGKEDTEKCQTFLAGLKDVLQLAGIDALELNLDGVYEYTSGYVGETAISRLKIAERGPAPKVTILAGSQFSSSVYDEIKVAAGLPGVTVDAQAKIYTFTQDATVDVTCVSPYIKKLYGHSLMSWKSRFGVGLNKVLEP